MKDKFIHSAIFIIVVLFLSSCATNQYHTAKTLKKGEKQFVIAGDSYLRPIAHSIKNGKQSEALLFSLPLGPSLEYNWGTRKKVDFTVGLSTGGQVSFALKNMIYGNEDSKFSMSLIYKVGVATIPNYTSDGQQLWANLPFVFTYEFNKSNSLTISTGVILSLPGWNFGSNNQPEFQRAFLNTSIAYHFGKKNRFFMAYSFMNVKTDLGNWANQASMGYIIKFGKPK